MGDHTGAARPYDPVSQLQYRGLPLSRPFPFPRFPKVRRVKRIFRLCRMRLGEPASGGHCSVPV